MEIRINNSKLGLRERDITEEDTEAIVNAANRSLHGVCPYFSNSFEPIRTILAPSSIATL